MTGILNTFWTDKYNLIGTVRISLHTHTGRSLLLVVFSLSGLDTETEAAVLGHEALVHQSLDVEIIPDTITVLVVTDGLTGGQTELLHARLRDGVCLV